MTYERVQENLRKQPRAWLVTGAAGFIGSHLVENLLKLGQPVVGLDNFSLGKHSTLAMVKEAVGEPLWKNFRFIEGDICSLDTCRDACRSVDYVLHQAALGSVPRSIADPLTTHHNNVTGFLNMLVAARDAKVRRFVYAGSSATYGNHPRLPRVESEIGRPLSPYGLSKYIDELYAEVFAQCYGLESIGLRYFNVFGPRQDPGAAYVAVIPLWVAAMIRDEPVYINGDGETTRDFCYVDNAVQANLLAALVENREAVNQVYNVAVNEQTSLNELFAMVRTLLEPHFPHVRDVSPRYRDFREGDVQFSRGDVSKAQRLLGYQPAWRVGRGLARAVEWYVNKLSPQRPAETMAALRTGTDGRVETFS